MQTMSALVTRTDPESEDEDGPALKRQRLADIFASLDAEFPDFIPEDLDANSLLGTKSIEDPMAMNCTNEMGEDRFEEACKIPPGMTAEEFEGYASLSGCHARVSVVFCDENREPKDTFTVGETIYVLLSVFSKEHLDIFVRCNKGTLGDQGLYMIIEGAPQYDFIPSPVNPAVVRIPPQTAYTFFRKFTDGDSNERDARVRCVTPKKPGVYTARVHNTDCLEDEEFFLFPGSFQFKVI